MTELAIAVDADDELWTLDALPTPEAPYVEVESELIEVRSRFPSSYYTLTGETLPPRIRVRRGIAGTTKASHIQGSTLTPNYGLGSGGGGGAIAVTDGVTTVAAATSIEVTGGTVTDEGGGVASVAVQTRLIGPVSVPFDHADIAGNFGLVRIGELAANATVVKFWAVMTEDFEGTVAKVVLVISDTFDGNSSISLSELSLAYDETSSSPEYGREISAGAWAAFGETLINYVGVAGSSGAWLHAVFGAGTLTAGELDVYALIAEPA